MKETEKTSAGSNACWFHLKGQRTTTHSTASAQNTRFTSTLLRAILMSVIQGALLTLGTCFCFTVYLYCGWVCICFAFEPANVPYWISWIFKNIQVDKT